MSDFGTYYQIWQKKNKARDARAINNLLDEIRRQKYADIEHAQAPNIFDYEDYHQYKLDQEYYENKLLEQSHLMPPERQAEIKAIRERRDKKFQKQQRDYYLGWFFKIIFFVVFMYWAWNL